MHMRGECKDTDDVQETGVRSETPGTQRRWPVLDFSPPSHLDLS
jgi:hypothetical protein